MNKLGNIATWAGNVFKSNPEDSAQAQAKKTKASSQTVERPDISNIDWKALTNGFTKSAPCPS
ncbi:hypothetical protein [Pseudomonas antarctica]|uniref:hypothetical protein n=1 Tax=Pseudomonas antarctica TaxID=219572 RepID=UPI001428C096|nr:hypothetical protein [Pseudomonas antarctica]